MLPGVKMKVKNEAGIKIKKIRIRQTFILPEQAKY
jgi:hypothetical protein